jgi:hypothetical protein
MDKANLDLVMASLNFSNEDAADFSANYMTWPRSLVSMIERSDGGQGGTA